MTSPPTPDITRDYIRIGNNYGLYEEASTKNFTGYVGGNDLSMPLVSDQYEKMIAENKNFFMQQQERRESNLWGSTTNILLSALGGGIGGAMATGGNPVGAIAGVATGLIGGIFNTAKNYISDVKQQSMTIDNLKSAPADISNAKGNYALTIGVKDPGVYIEEWEVIPQDKNMINNYLNWFGYTYNRFGNVKDFAKIRKYFNYVKAQISDISGIPLSNTARQDIRERFARGIRFWNRDDVNYNANNYEKWLDEEPSV